jgi:uncharacterized RDD family membrane protein YckC
MTITTTTCHPNQYAGFWRRTAASLIDSAMFTVLLVLLFGFSFMNAQLLTPEGLLRSSVLLVLTVGLWRVFQGTPGKLLLSCQVVDADSHAPLSTRQASLRYVAYLASILPLMLGFLWVGWDKRKQGFHDKLANTVVLHGAELENDDESTKSLQQLLNEMR